VSFTAITLCAASQRVFIVVVVIVVVVVVVVLVYFVIDSVRELLDTPSYTLASLRMLNRSSSEPGVRSKMFLQFCWWHLFAGRTCVFTYIAVRISSQPTVTEQVSSEVTRLTCIPKVPASNLNRRIYCPYYPHDLQVNAEIMLSNRPRPASFHIFSNLSFTVILPFESAVKPEIDRD
jgi:uncharacterized membrane protein